MSIQIPKPQISGNIIPIIRSQNSSCVMVFYRFEDPLIANILTFNASNDKPLSNQVTGSSKYLTKKDPMIIRQDIVSCRCSNDKSGISGTFNATIKRGKKLSGFKNTKENVPYAYSINPGDWVMIYMKKSAQITDKDLASTKPESGLKFVGIVESVTVNEVVDQNGGVSDQIQIAGRSFGKVFDTNVVFSPILNKKPVETVIGGELLNSIKTFTKSNKAISPDAYVKAATEFFFKGKGSTQSQTNQSWYVPNQLAAVFKDPNKFKGAGRSIADLLDFTRVGLHKYSSNHFKGVDPLPGAGYFLAIPSSGTIWSILQFFANLATNEIYTELVPTSNGSLQMGLIHRQLPYSNKKGHSTNVFSRSKTSADAAGSQKTYTVDLPKLTIQSTDVIRKSVGKSDHERINYVSVVPRFFERDVTVVYTASMNPASIQRYGVKSFQTQTSYVLKEGIQSAQNFVRQSVSLLVDWFFLAHEFFSGSITIDGINSFVGVGDNVYIEDMKQLYHIQGYTHTYEVDIQSGRTKFFTTLDVIRGQYWDGIKARFIAETPDPNLDPVQVATTFIQTRNQDGSK